MVTCTDQQEWRTGPADLLEKLSDDCQSIVEAFNLEQQKLHDMQATHHDAIENFERRIADEVRSAISKTQAECKLIWNEQGKSTKETSPFVSSEPSLGMNSVDIKNKHIRMWK